MALAAGTYRLGPDNGTLSIRTARAGAAAKAGHDLLIHGTAWEGTVEVGENSALTSVALDADAGSLLVREGTGGMKALSEDDKAAIKQTIDEDVLRRQPIRFRSSEIGPGTDADSVTVRGDLTLAGNTRPLQFQLRVREGELNGSARIRQTDWAIKPYSALFGALKVADEVEVAIEATLTASARSR